MRGPEAEFKVELEAFRTESQAAIQFFYAWQTVNAVNAGDRRIARVMNQTSLFWKTTLGAMQTATLVALGRVFDPDPKNHSVNRLLSIAHGNLQVFSKQSFAARRRKEDRTADEWLPNFLSIVYEPTSKDIRRLKRYVAVRRRIYEFNYKPLRDQLFAHRAIADRAETDALFAKTNTRELQLMLVFFGRLYESLWQLFNNGRKPNLRPARYSVKRMREKPSPLHGQRKLQEQLIYERSNRPPAANRAEETLRSLWQSGRRRCGRPVRQWCVLPAYERGPG